MPRIVLIVLLMVMACVNVMLDFTRGEVLPDINAWVVFSVLVCGFATAFPAGVALLISAKTKFNIAEVKIYRLASDVVLGIGLSTWFYLLVIRERPNFYEGASHLYVATWPILLGLIAVLLYLTCLLVQGSCWVIKHNKSNQQGL
ncbi:hypothetical protein [Corallincola spongiicola]|uniref:TRAP transporter small permease subunit n=1 Tax=Corallincola spongiicola TaxID=2520508 RepID=A0ABY1WN18_9GAMM|nr:hypothetical protein [Corallincola spongiicola]TAA43697.1 hypothetical protein EXY25_14195 [Corallincola spongiicola]